jgi:peptidylprolyl isomerase
MKLVTALLLTSTAALGQTTAKPVTHSTTATHTAARAAGCAKLPPISPKVPALPPGLPCAKPLYTITSVPSVKLDYVSPLEGPELRQTLGIEPTSFSLDYIDVKIGTGPLAAPHKWYTIHYTGYLTDGTKFDSSVDRNEPFTIAYGMHTVIPGWDTGFDGMHVGGKRRLFIPFQLAYGSKGNGPIPPQSELIFDVELLSQSDSKPEPKTPPAPPTPPPAPAAPAAAPSNAPAAPAKTNAPAGTPPPTPPNR